MSLGNNIKESVFKAKILAGIDITVLADASLIYHIQLLEKRGKSLAPSKSFRNISDKNLVYKTLKDLKCPVIINLHGKGIIHRAFQDAVKHNYAEALNRVVPSGNENDFHIQLYNSTSGNSFISILRKQVVSELLQEMEVNKVDVVGFLLGNYHLELLLPLLEQKTSLTKIKLPGQELFFEDGDLREIKSTDNLSEGDVLSIDGEGITSDLFPALAAAMSYFIPLGKIVHNNQSVHFLTSEYANKKAFVNLSRVLIAFLLVLALGNFFLFNQYFKQQADLDGELAVYESSLNQFEKLNTQLQSKQDFVEKSGLQSNSKLSFYSDRILYDAPKEVQLNYFSIAPIIKRIENDSVIRFESKKILIKGSCTKSIVLNEWIKLIKTKDFVQDVVLENYNQESDVLNGKFDLAVKLK